jgi:hypothetical protein
MIFRKTIPVAYALLFCLAACGLKADKGGNGSPPSVDAPVTDPELGAEWTQYFAEHGVQESVARDILVDASGIYVAGQIATVAGGEDIFIARIDPASGAVLWKQQLDGQLHAEDKAYELTLYGNDLCVTGSIRNSGQNSDLWVAKFDAMTGAILWQKTMTGTGFDAWGRAITATANGIYVAGSVNNNLVAVRFDLSTGNILWSKQFSGDSGSTDTGWFVSAGSDGLYVAGIVNNTATGMDAWLGKLDLLQGSMLWEVVTNDPVDEFAFGLVLGTSGPFLHGGTALNPHWVKSVNGTTGGTNWTRFLPGTYTDVNDMVNGPRKAIDWDTGLVAVAASTGYATIFFGLDDAGSGILWQSTLAGAGGGDDRIFGLEIDAASAAIFATGVTVDDPAKGPDILVCRVGTSGGILWQQAFNGSANDPDQGRAIGFDGTYVYVAGKLISSAPRSEIWVKQLAK